MSQLANPMHPGEVLKELYLDPMGIGAIALARRLGVPRTRIEHRTALRDLTGPAHHHAEQFEHDRHAKECGAARGIEGR